MAPVRSGLRSVARCLLGDAARSPGLHRFLSHLGLVYFWAFGTYYVQFPGLFGRSGLLPVAESVGTHRGSFLESPNLISYLPRLFSANPALAAYLDPELLRVYVADAFNCTERSAPHKMGGGEMGSRVHRVTSARSSLGMLELTTCCVSQGCKTACFLPPPSYYWDVARAC